MLVASAVHPWQIEPVFQDEGQSFFQLDIVLASVPDERVATLEILTCLC